MKEMKEMKEIKEMKGMGFVLVPSWRVRLHFCISAFTFIIPFISFIAHLALCALIVSCSSGSEGFDEPKMPSDGPSVLNIYVYAPGQAVPTRGNTGEVDANPDAEENAINTLQIWVFTHKKYEKEGEYYTENESGTQRLVTYFETTTTSDKYELPIPDWYAANNPENVDVFVLANVTSNNCGLDFDEETTHAELEGAVLKGNYFGLSTTPVMAVPYEGLPMSGVLYNQTVSDTRPILTLGSSSSMAAVKLARAVSRIRFVFSCSNNFDGLKINSVTLGNGMIPNEEYLFLKNPSYPDPANLSYTYEGNYVHINTTEGYNVVDNEHPAPSLFSIDATAQCEDPAHYAWDRLMNDEKAKDPAVTDQALATAYEALINDGVSTIHEGETNVRLTERRVYLRESDKQLSGTIKFQAKEKGAADYSVEKEASFSMVGPENLEEWQPFFSRNHTWIVYAYLAWAKIEIVAVKIVPWTSGTGEQNLYNW
jgi:hypothetical protein